jgi:hypothetical protein
MKELKPTALKKDLTKSLRQVAQKARVTQKAERSHNRARKEQQTLPR